MLVMGSSHLIRLRTPWSGCQMCLKNNNLLVQDNPIITTIWKILQKCEILIEGVPEYGKSEHKKCESVQRCSPIEWPGH